MDAICIISKLLVQQRQYTQREKTNMQYSTTLISYDFSKINNRSFIYMSGI